VGRINKLSVLFLVVAPLAWTQTPQSPELKQLQPMAGQWTCAGETKTEPIIKLTGAMECSWEKTGKILICQTQEQVGSTSMSFVGAYAYDAAAKVYVIAEMSSIGFPNIYSGSLQNGKWGFAREGVWWGKAARYEISVTFGSAETQTFASRRSVAGGPWVVTSEGKCTKRK
jgi:hypothetical protein